MGRLIMTIDETIEYLKNFKEKSHKDDPSVYIEIVGSKFDLEEDNIRQDWNGNLVVDFSDLSWDDISI